MLCLGADVLEDADDLDLELLDLRALEDGAADADHAGADVVERQDLDGAARRATAETARQERRRASERSSACTISRRARVRRASISGSRRRARVATRDPDPSSAREEGGVDGYGDRGRGPARQRPCPRACWPGCCPGAGTSTCGATGKGAGVPGRHRRPLRARAWPWTRGSRWRSASTTSWPRSSASPRWRSALPYFAARALGFEAGQVTSVTHEYGNTFTAVGGLLNILVILDAYDTAVGRKP